jgi:pilus assembly protein CpaB
MKRAVIVIIGLLVAVIGAAMLAGAVEQARDEAASGPGTVEVLVVRERVPRLTPVDDLGSAVALVSVPDTALVPGAITSLDAVTSGYVTTAELLPGEQVLADRFAAPQTVERLEVPEGLQEVTLAIASSRALGGTVVVGDRVGVVGSFSGQASGAVSVTDFILHRVLVTAVQYSSGDVAQVQQGVNGSPDVPVALQGALLITLAVSAQDAASLIYTDQFGSIALTREDEAAEFGSEQPVTLDSVFAGAR